MGYTLTPTVLKFEDSEAILKEATGQFLGASFLTRLPPIRPVAAINEKNKKKKTKFFLKNISSGLIPILLTVCFLG